MANFNLNDLLEKTAQDSDGCLIWQKAKSSAGYGQIWDGTKVLYAHRIVAELTYGKPTTKLDVLHSCDKPSCINPKHLSWGSRKENMIDASNKGRLTGKNHVKGSRHPNTPFVADKIIEIRNARNNGATLSCLSKDYKVSIAAIHAIVTHKTWKEVV